MKTCLRCLSGNKIMRKYDMIVSQQYFSSVATRFIPQSPDFSIYIDKKTYSSKMIL